MKKTIIIGDVHGCSRELDMLLEKLKPEKDCRLVFLGDLINKGPDSVGVVKRVYNLAKELDVTLITGNHEDKFLRFADHVKNNNSALKEMTDTEPLQILLDNLNDKEISFLKNSLVFTHFSDVNLTCVHGGIPANTVIDDFSAIPYKELSRKKKHHLLLFTRFLDPEGNFLSLGSETALDKIWAASYDGKWGTVVFGHQPFDRVQRYPHAVGLDTGCVFGGSLTALVVENNIHNFIYVKSLFSYAEKPDK